MHKLKKILMDQLKEHEAEIEKMGGRMTATDLDKICKITDIIKNLSKIEMYEGEGGYSKYSREGHSYGYDQDGSWEARGEYSREPGYDEDGNSYRRRRDSMGRYARDEGKDRMIERLHDMMSKATSEKEREALKRCISTLENA